MKVIQYLIDNHSKVNFYMIRSNKNNLREEYAEDNKRNFC